MAQKIDCVCSKILDHGLSHGLLFSSFLCGKRSKLSENSGVKSRLLDFLIFQFYLNVQANLPETSPIFVSQNGFGGHLFSNVYSTWDV